MSIRRRTFLQWLAGWTGAAKAQESASSADSSATAYRVQTADLLAEISDQGRILRLKLGPKTVEIPLRACTVLAGCRTDGAVAHRAVNGGAEFVRKLIHEPTGERCQMMERFLPTPTSIRWTVEIEAAGALWTTAIETQAALLRPAKAKFWTAWDHRAGACIGTTLYYRPGLQMPLIVTVSRTCGTATNLRFAYPSPP
jgi:hypothetical protein